MKDQEKKVNATVIRCLLARLNGYARAGVIMTPYSDSASLYDEGDVRERLKGLNSYTFSKDIPVVGERYRRNRFTDGCTSLTVWHRDEAGPWMFTDDERFCLASRPSAGEWKVDHYKGRGEFREFNECAMSAGEADLIAEDEIK